MLKNNRRILSAFAATIMIAALFSGCTNSNKEAIPTKPK